MYENGKQCETCAYLEYDYEEDCNYCTVNLDEDELANFYSGSKSVCPYYRFYEEYKMVRKQN